MQTIVTLDFLVPIIDNFGDLGFALELALGLTRCDPSIRVRIWSQSHELFVQMLPNCPQDIEYHDLGDYNPEIESPLACTFFGYKLGQGVHSHKRILQFDYLQFAGAPDSPSSRAITSFHGTQYSDRALDITHLVPSIGSAGGGIVPRTLAPLSPTTAAALTREKLATVFVYPSTYTAIEPVLRAHPEWQFLILGQNTTTSSIQDANLSFLPFLPITEVPALYAECHLNIVRGENTLVTALTSGRPFLWDIYQESNGVHSAKMQDFVDYLPGDCQYLEEFMRSPALTLERLLSGGTPGSILVPPLPDLVALVQSWITDSK